MGSTQGNSVARDVGLKYADLGIQAAIPYIIPFADELRQINTIDWPRF